MLSSTTLPLRIREVDERPPEVGTEVATTLFLEEDVEKALYKSHNNTKGYYRAVKRELFEILVLRLFLEASLRQHAVSICVATITRHANQANANTIMVETNITL